MYQIRKSTERGQANHGWLQSQHSFSFANYYDPAHMGFRSLRVINEDIVAPSKGFGTHGHKNMEIISYVISGALQHKDSMGSGSIMKPGDVQYMSAGSGVMHSEFNGSHTEKVHFLQIWITPNTHNTRPQYKQENFAERRKNTLCCIVSPDGESQSLPIHQNSYVYACELSQSKSCTHNFSQGRAGWIQMISGTLTINTQITLHSGDGCAISEEKSIHLTTDSDAHFLLFDLA